MNAQVPAASEASTPSADLVAQTWDYWIDAWQRSVLLLDVLRQRGERYQEHIAKIAPHVLKFGCELVLDGRKLKRPVNYLLVRMTPPAGVEIDEGKRPFVIVDPRAGHGPGIGGFKPESEIGVAFKAGHPCYFIGFLPDPVPGQTIEDIAHAEAAFLERVIALHPDAEGKPAVIGNCQAGWAVMMVAAMRPELFGPIIVAGSPLSYWAGVRGEKSHALHGRFARRKLADRPHGRPRQRKVRRRLACIELRESQSVQYVLEQTLQPLFQDRHRGTPLSRVRAMVGRARPA